MNINTLKMQMNWKVLEEISKAGKKGQGLALNKLPTAAMIKAELDMNSVILTTAFAALKFSSAIDATLVHNAYECLQLLSFAFDPRRDEVKHPPHKWEILERAISDLQIDKRKVIKLLNRSVTSQVSKVEQTCESVVVENQSDYNNTQDGNNKKGKGNKEHKSKKSKGKKK